MDITDQNLHQLQEKLEQLKLRQSEFDKEIKSIQAELNQLTEKKSFEAQIQKPSVIHDLSAERQVPVASPPVFPMSAEHHPLVPRHSRLQFKTDVEKFIGENLINKIGIAITIIGIAIGVKYSIEHQLISPLTRIVLGYLFGMAMMGVALKLKKGYHNFSAVLLSGALAILYFMTFAAYGFYGLIPQIPAFAIMVTLTLFTVVAALHYKVQAIAIIGLVGAYAVPFLLSDGSGKVLVLFTYMAIINFGVLIVAMTKYWKILHYSAFGLTWLIVLSWYFSRYSFAQHFSITLFFISSFFGIFYVVFLFNKLKKQLKLEFDDVVLLLANSFLFFGLGYSVLSGNPKSVPFLGLFAIVNALIHFVVSALLYRNKLADKQLFYFVTGLVLVFLTIAIPVQLDGNWVTLLWVTEALVLFAFGRIKKISIYEVLSYPLMVLAFFSLINDWSAFYHTYQLGEQATFIRIFFNVNFLTAVICIASYSAINVINHQHASFLPIDSGLKDFINFAMVSVLLIVTYSTFSVEISNYWYQRFLDSRIEFPLEETSDFSEMYNYSLNNLKRMWQINFSLIFFIGLSWINIKWIKNRLLANVNLVFNSLVLVVFLFGGLYALSLLRDAYLNPDVNEYYHHSMFYIFIRYISLGLLTGLIWIQYLVVNQEFLKRNLTKVFEMGLSVTLLWVLSSELLHWLDIFGVTQSHKLMLSILWGVYALFLVIIGIHQQKKHLRVGAIILLGITLLKLFLFDISEFGTLAKTIVFVSLGILLLAISFLYNKFKKLIIDGD
jgi:uncharacterized membrane protein